jgi:hypothetical protein
MCSRTRSRLGSETTWNLRNRNNQFVASGVYFFRVGPPRQKPGWGGSPSSTSRREETTTMTARLTRVLGTLMGLAALGLAPLGAQTTQDNTGYGGTSGEFLLLGAGARGAALGGAYAALTTDVTALYYNAAGLAQMGGRGRWYRVRYVDGTRYSWVGIGMPLGGGARAVGFQVGSFGFSDQPVYTLDDPDGTGETYSVSETFLAGTYSQNFSDRFSAGFTVKLVSDQLGSTKATGFAVDFGTNFHALIGERPIRAAFVIQNLGTNLRHDGAALSNLAYGYAAAPGRWTFPRAAAGTVARTSSWGLPGQFRVGVALDVLSMGMNRVSVLGSSRSR